jgi:hypothetical protein
MTAQAASREGILKLPARLRRDLILLIVIKLAMLSLLYVLFFAPSHHTGIDMASHISDQRRN